MKREVARERKIPAFSIGVGELETLWGRMIALFDNPEKIYTSINIKLPTETLKFNNIEDLKQYANLKGRIKTFSLFLSHSGRHLSIEPSSFLDSQSIVRAAAETEAWCAGAIETVYSFLQSYKMWYHLFVSAPIGWIIILLLNAPTLVFLALPKGSTLDKTTVIGWIFTLIALSILYVFRGKLFPASVLRVTEEEGFVRRHSAELGLIVALLSVVLTIVSLFLRK